MVKKEIEITPEMQEIINKEVEKLTIETREKAITYRSQIDQMVESKSIILASEMFDKEKTTSIQLKEFNDQKTQLEWLATQKALPKDETAGQTLMKIRMWKQMWLTEFEAINGIWFVNGRMTVWWEVMVWMLTKAWYRLKFIKSDEKICDVEISKDWESMQESFTIEEANKAWWTSKWFVWKNQPKLMLRYKAIRQVCKFFCPHVLGWMITTEEAQTELPWSIQEAEIVDDEIIEQIKNCTTVEELTKFWNKVRDDKKAFSVYATKLKELNSK